MDISIYDNLGRGIAQDRRFRMSKKELRKEADRLYDKVRDLQGELENRDNTIRLMSKLNQEAKELKGIAIRKSKELELMYLRAIGNATTVKEVRDIEERYRKYGGTLTRHPERRINVGLGFQITPAKWESEIDLGFFSAVATKIKRLNKKRVDDAINSLHAADASKDDELYVAIMEGLLKSIIYRDVDGVKIIEAKNMGLHPRSVFKSILIQSGINPDSVM